MDKIARAVDVCLSQSTQSALPLATIAEFVADLRRDPRWSDEEVIEVQSRTIRLLLKQIEDRAG